MGGLNPPKPLPLRGPCNQIPANWHTASQKSFDYYHLIDRQILNV